MNMSTKVFIECNGNVPEESSIEYSPTESRIKLDNNLFGCIEITEENFLECFNSIRLELEKRNCYILVNGSRKDFVVSGMSNQMSGGLKGYIVQIGEPGRRENMVDILGYADRNLIGTIEEQENFYNDWLSSILNK